MADDRCLVYLLAEAMEVREAVRPGYRSGSRYLHYLTSNLASHPKPQTSDLFISYLDKKVTVNSSPLFMVTVLSFLRCSTFRM